MTRFQKTEWKMEMRLKFANGYHYISLKHDPARVNLTLYQLLSGLLRHFRFQNPTFPNFLDKNNHKFKMFQALLDNLFKGLKKEGIGSESKHAEIISKEEEKILWDTNLLNLTTSKGLLRAVFYYNGKIFACVVEVNVEILNYPNSRDTQTITYTSRIHPKTTQGEWLI